MALRKIAGPRRDGVRLVAVVQCAIALERCSGFSCARAFHDRTHFFQGYGDDVLYVPFSCGGCPGRRVSRLAEHVVRMAERKEGIRKRDIAAHLTGCVVRDNGHYPECPFKDYMKAILEQKGLTVIEGGYESTTAAERRKEGHYNAYAGLKKG
jgi:predicted metal-binding protein